MEYIKNTNFRNVSTKADLVGFLSDELYIHRASFSIL